MVTRTGDGAMHVHALRPHGHLLKQASFAFLALVTPLCAALYWLSIPSGPWLAVLIAQGLATVVFGWGVIASVRAVIWVDRTAVTERGFFGRVHSFSTSEVASVVMLDLYQSGALDTDPQLFLVDADGCLLLRMRGQFWSHASMETLADVLGKRVVRVPEPVTLRELNRARPQLLYWFERR
jgi:hypothetical protein